MAGGGAGATGRADAARWRADGISIGRCLCALAAALTQGLIALDWREGGNLRLDWRWAGGDPALFERYTAELVTLRPDVLVAQGSPAVEAMRRQSRATPIEFVMVVDPVGQGFVASLARPGGTITGFTNYEPPMAGK